MLFGVSAKDMGRSDAVNDPKKDSASADSVLKRADAEMYRNKLAMKAARTD